MIILCRVRFPSAGSSLVTFFLFVALHSGGGGSSFVIDIVIPDKAVVTGLTVAVLKQELQAGLLFCCCRCCNCYHYDWLPQRAQGITGGCKKAGQSRLALNAHVSWHWGPKYQISILEKYQQSFEGVT